MLTIADVADVLAVSTATVYKLVASGALPCGYPGTPRGPGGVRGKVEGLRRAGSGPWTSSELHECARRCRRRSDHTLPSKITGLGSPDVLNPSAAPIVRPVEDNLDIVGEALDDETSRHWSVHCEGPSSPQSAASNQRRRACVGRALWVVASLSMSRSDTGPI
jgi:excisionase family DNA binding protein